MIRKTNKFSKPRKAYELVRIKEENVLMEKYGLKNKKEIWKTIAKVNYFRKRAMDLARATAEEQEILFSKLRGLGLKINTIADVLALKVEDLLNRRLPTILHKRKFATTAKHARQMIVHKRVMIDNKVVNVPSYLVSLGEEENISIRKGKDKPVKHEKKEEKSEKVEVKAEAEE